MSHYYGTLQGNRGKATRCGTKKSGIETWAASWEGAIRVFMWHDKETGYDRVRIELKPWQWAGESALLFDGTLQELNAAAKINEIEPVSTPYAAQDFED